MNELPPIQRRATLRFDLDMSVFTDVLDGLLPLIEAGDVSAEVAGRFLSSVESNPNILFQKIHDKPARRAGEAVILLEPADELLSLRAAIRAGDRDLHAIHVALSHFIPSDDAGGIMSSPFEGVES